MAIFSLSLTHTHTGITGAHSNTRLGTLGKGVWGANQCLRAVCSLSEVHHCWPAISSFGSVRPSEGAGEEGEGEEKKEAEVKMKNRKVEGSSPETMMTQGVVREENRKGEEDERGEIVTCACG